MIPALLLFVGGLCASCAPEYSEPDIGAPAKLTATPDDSAVLLSWTAVADANSYRVYYNQIGGVTQNDEYLPSKGTSLTVKKLDNGTSYSFAVSSVSLGGVVGKGLSKEVAAVPAPAIPSAPQNLVAVANVGFVSLTWNKSYGATSYIVYFAGQAGVTDKSAPLKVGDVTAFVHQNLPYDTTYYYRVQAVNAGGASELSDEVYATLPPDPTVTPTPTP